MINELRKYLPEGIRYTFKCRECSREMEISRDIIMVVCPCGVINEFEIVMDIKLEVCESG